MAILERGQLIVAGPLHDIARQLGDLTQARAADARPPQPASTGAPLQTPLVAEPRTRGAKLKVLAPPEAVALALAGVAGVAKVTPAPGGVAIVAYTGDDRSLAEIVRIVVMSGIPVVGVEPERNELERIFLEATRGDVQ